MTTGYYRTTSGEVLKISLNNNPFVDVDTTYFTIFTDPAFPDGTQLREELPDGSDGPLRQLGYAKHFVAGTVRNSTQVEIDSYASFEATDTDLQDASRAADLGDTDPIWRKLIKAIVKQTIRENNIQADDYNALRAEMLAATSLGDLQARIRDNTSDMPTRTYEQGYNAIRSDVDPNE